MSPNSDMILVHDDDLVRLDGIYNSTVSRNSVQYTIVLMFSLSHAKLPN